MKIVISVMVGLLLAGCASTSVESSKSEVESTQTEFSQAQTKPLPAPWPKDIQVPFSWEIRRSSESDDGSLLATVLPDDAKSWVEAAIAVDEILVQNGHRNVGSEDSDDYLYTYYENADYAMAVQVEGPSHIIVSFFLVPK
jgi:uncharacterized protein YceK